MFTCKYLHVWAWRFVQCLCVSQSAITSAKNIKAQQKQTTGVNKMPVLSICQQSPDQKHMLQLLWFTASSDQCWNCQLCKNPVKGLCVGWWCEMPDEQFGVTFVSLCWAARDRWRRMDPKQAETYSMFWLKCAGILLILSWLCVHMDMATSHFIWVKRNWRWVLIKADKQQPKRNCFSVKRLVI